MPRKPDVLCAGLCGRLLWSSSTSLPAGMRMCRECRASSPKQPRDNRISTEKSCEACRTEFRPHRTSVSPRFCSLSCAGRVGASRLRTYVTPEAKAAAERLRYQRKSDLRRARKLGVEYEVINRRTVFDRDGWICGICYEPVDPSLRWPHAESVSLDHVIPLSRGGSHTYGNVQCAHARCNTRKGARLDEREAA